MSSLDVLNELLEALGSATNQGIKVTIPDHGDFWFMGAHLGQSAPIAPLAHCDEEGRLDFAHCFDSETYAHWFPERGLLRYRTRLGGAELLPGVPPAPEGGRELEAEG